MAFRCPNCGGSIVFDIGLQAMRCQHCDSVMVPESLRTQNSTREDIPEAGFALYACSGCGAELTGTEDSAVGFCPYCGGQSLLRAPGGAREKTDYVLPFQIGRDKCAELFREHNKGVRYLPKDLRNPGDLENLTGIYMPFYEYDVQVGASQITGTKTVESHPRYDVVNTYSIDAQVSGGCCGVTFDASRNLDDEIAARVLPFDVGLERPFHPAYLSGYYADASTVPPETYMADAAEQASKDIVEEVADQMRAGPGIQVDVAASHVYTATAGFHRSMLPLWFLTWRRNNRVAYAVINGQSGKVVSDLPMDLRSFALGCAVAAAALFLLLELLFQPTPLVTSCLSLAAGALMALSVRNSTHRIYEKQTHANDKGWFAGAAPDTPAGAVQADASKPNKKSGNSSLGTIIVIILAIAAYLVMDIRLPILVVIAAAAITLLALLKVSGWQREIPEKQPIAAMLLILLGVVLNVAVVLISPVDDLWYYLGDAVCILILVLASVLMMRVYNIGTTRPLPKLFGRQEVQ